MGSIVISDVVCDIARHPHAMVVGDTRQTSATPSEKPQTPSVRSYPSQSSIPTYTPQRIPSAIATPTRSSTTGSSASLARLASQHARSASSASRPSSRPVSRDFAQYQSSESLHQQQPDAETPLPSVQPSVVANGFVQSGFPPSTNSKRLASTPPSPRLQPTIPSSLSLAGSGSTSPSRIKVRDLSHIQSFASEEILTRSRHGSRYSLQGGQDGGQQYEISAMPVTDIIEMVAGLLTKITTSNDQLHDHLHRQIPLAEGATGLSRQATSILAFHGKNVPSITILSYLSRIHKYCPTTYEVFLSLLVYFDTMAEKISNGSLESFRHVEYGTEAESRPSSSTGWVNIEGTGARPQSTTPTPPSSSSHPSSTQIQQDHLSSQTGSVRSKANDERKNLFAVDSFNIHRLVIAGVTCASKFFSDVFYTNSRYAKVSANFCFSFFFFSFLVFKSRAIISSNDDRSEDYHYRS